ncbi:ABC transporter ATP-binding protein [Fructobacillus tropaeoli]|uniref:ATP-binding protein n=1 Tax=Fructobacillus tropaeoli TaxID=709323 RepID=A0A3F3H880_9LACO|nr:AAA family ATPase [Fructobacillus tropaeoli]GAP03760.1 ATP-binding protein [Fructobacillus tropaeoli]GIC70098.1 AAA family ATPase [Fructobacillus tropaeoli]CAK1229692.1 ABC-type multidrug transport system [Fructobacillus tropaeoli]CAK1231014.1 ABC-type multidrug transport system [Fructobacillus tropaeoli]
MKVEKCDIYAGERLLIRQGSFVVDSNRLNLLIGNNGVGKTVILDKISNLDRNRPAEFIGFPDAKDIIYQTQGASFIDEVTVLTTLKLFGEMAGVDLVNHLNLPEIISKNMEARFGNLSGGERRFIIIWASLQVPRKLYLFDEPFANLDPYHVSQLMKLFYSELATGKTILLTTHQFEELIPDRTHITHIAHQKVDFDGTMTDFMMHHGDDLQNVLKEIAS